MRSDSGRGFLLDVPAGWAFRDAEDEPIALWPETVPEAPVQVSLIKKSDSRRSPPTEKSAGLWLVQIQSRLIRNKVEQSSAAGRLDLAEANLAGVPIVVFDTWPVEDSMCAWVDFEAEQSDENGDSQPCYAAGAREWVDSVLILTWIGAVNTLAYRRDARDIFESINRVQTQSD